MAERDAGALELRRSHLSRAVLYVGSRAGEVLRRRFESFVDDGLNLESPVESLFALWWHVQAFLSHPVPSLILNPQQLVIANGSHYRLDFVVSWPPFIDGPRIAIEVDGHAFHERTAMQVEQRDRRDADLTVANWAVFHYAAHTVLKHPERTSAEAYRQCLELYLTWLMTTDHSNFVVRANAPKEP